MRVYLLIFISLIIYSCAPTTESNKIILPQFYWNLDDFSNPQVVVYNLDSLGFSKTEYFIMENLGNNRLKITNYNNQFIKTRTTIQKYENDGVYLDAVFIAKGIDSVKLVAPEIQSGFIFPFNDIKDSLKIKYHYLDFYETPIEIHFEENWKFEGLSYNEGMNSEIETLKTKGSQQRTAYSSKGEKLGSYSCLTQIHYKKGFGIIHMIRLDSNGTLEYTYKETISLEQFEKLKSS